MKAESTSVRTRRAIIQYLKQEGALDSETLASYFNITAMAVRQQKIEAYQAILPKRASLKRRLDALATQRTEEGYMAEIIVQADGTYLFAERHCPICAVATACTGLCRMELEIFQAALGRDVTIERTEHILNGDRRCVYRVKLQHDS